MTKDVFELQKSQNIPFATTLEVKIDRVGEKNFSFPNDTELQKKFIIGMFVTFPSATGTTLSRTGKPLLPLEKMLDAYLTLTSCAKDFLKNAPLKMFDVSNKPLLYVPIYAEGITLNDSMISLNEKIVAGNGAGAVSLDSVIQFTFIHL